MTYAEAFRSHDDHYSVGLLEFRRASRLPRHDVSGPERCKRSMSNRRPSDIHLTSPLLNFAVTEHMEEKSINKTSIYHTLSTDAQIGVGSFGKVYRMTSKTDPRLRFAVKIVPKHHRNLPEDVVLSRLHDEVDILRTLQSCPETVRLVDVTEDGQQVYIVMELCEGGDLLQFLKEHGRMTEWEAAHTAKAILRLLCECHQQGILYADLKPNNILLKRRYRRMRSSQQSLQLRIADFGCSQRLQGGRLNTWAGTPAFMAPEVFKRQRGVASDQVLHCYQQATESNQWSLGMVMYQMLTGRLPFWGTDSHPSPFRVMAAILKDEVRYDGPEWRGVSKAARDFVRRLLERDPAIRMSAEQALAHPWIKRHCDLTRGVPPVANNAVPAIRNAPQN